MKQICDGHVIHTHTQFWKDIHSAMQIILEFKCEMKPQLFLLGIISGKNHQEISQFNEILHMFTAVRVNLGPNTSWVGYSTKEEP